MSMLPVGFGASGDYTIEESLRFNASQSSYLSWTPASAGNRKTWTWSGWVKRGALGGAHTLFDSTWGANSNSWVSIRISSDTLYIDTYNETMQTTAVFRDPSAWYHIVYAIDTTQATAADRVKIYVNGVQQTVSGTFPALNADTGVNTTNLHSIGRYNWGNSLYFDGYLTEVNFIDGQALDPSSFGEFDATTGVWKPKEYTGTYGTNGFFLDFSDATSATTLGYDYSGNSNNWTLNNFNTTSTNTAYCSMTDTPTLYADGGNYAVLNPLDYVNSATASQGNLYYTNGSTGVIRSTVGMPDNSGKFYFEITQKTAVNSSNPISYGFSSLVGSPSQSAPQRAAYLYSDNASGHSVFIYENGAYLTAVNHNITSVAVDDILQFAYDTTTGNLWVGQNNSWCDASGGFTGNPSTGANPVYTFSLANQPLTPTFSHAGVGYQAALNCGQRPFAYTPPTGFLPLHTGNLPDSNIVDGSKYFDVVLWTGDGAQTRSFTDLEFQPDLVWAKIRSGTTQDHQLYDAVRGAGGGKNLSSNTTAVEGTVNGFPDADYGYVSSFDSNGFSVNDGAVATTGGYVNYSGRAYVAWNWKANGTGVTNNAGSIESIVSANQLAGFSIVTYTGTGSAGTVGHGLGAAPSMIITKKRNAVGTDYGWSTYHVSNGTANIWLDKDNKTNPGNWPTAPTDTVFTPAVLAYNNVSTATYVNYCFAEVEGYSKFGSYTGNGLPDGPFVYLGFRPAFVLLKNTTISGESWYIFDTARSTYNVTNTYLLPNVPNTEVTTVNRDFDIVSNGLKLRNTNGAMNASGSTYIYMAFAENPFKNSLAR